jgi:circadian clock protein KaiC
MTDKVPIHRLSTGVPGLDAVLGGGLPEFSFNVVAGAPGAGKTTLVQQIMFTLARPRSTGPLFHRARRTAAEDAPLSAAVRVLQHRGR